MNGVQLSNEHRSFIINEDNDDWKDHVSNATLPTYDFYIRNHDAIAEDVGGTIHDFAGQHFTEDIFKKSGGQVNPLTMAEQADGAVEYLSLIHI